jgi:hypothetical protein
MEDSVSQAPNAPSLHDVIVSRFAEGWAVVQDGQLHCVHPSGPVGSEQWPALQVALTIGQQRSVAVWYCEGPMYTQIQNFRREAPKVRPS